MRENLSKPIEVLRTPYGRWVWWPALQVIDYHVKGRSLPSKQVTLDLSANYLDGAITAAAKAESDSRLGIVRTN